MNTISAIEAKINTLKSSKNKNDYKEIEKLKAEIRSLQEKYKSIAHSLEQTNYSRLIFVDSTNGFKKLIGHSALIYANDIAKRIGRRANLIADSDRYSRSVEGIVSLKLSDALISSLSSIDIILSPQQEQNGLTFFMLPRTYSQKEIEEIKNNVKKTSERITSLIIPKSPIPSIFSNLRELNFLIFINTQNMSPFGREIIGKNLASTSDKMMLRYCEIANKDLDVTDGLLRIIKGAKYIKYELKNAENLHLIHGKAIMDILILVINIETEAMKEYNKQKLTTSTIISQATKEKNESKF